VAKLRELIGALESRYDPAWAEDWDAVGLVCGDPEADVTRVHFAVDPAQLVVAEAVAAGAQLLVTHHPLFLGGTTSVAATTAKGRVVHSLMSNRVALYVAHTNADVAMPGVSDALGEALGLNDLRPLRPRPGHAVDKLVTFVPAEAVDRILDVLAAAGAGDIGTYSRCAFLTDGTGTFRPRPDSVPAVGAPGQTERTAEVRIEMVLPSAGRGEAIRALVAAHPYEEPAYDVIPLVVPPDVIGLGRVGDLDEAVSLREFTKQVAARLPATTWGVRAAGDPDRKVRRVAVCGGAGGDLVDEARTSGADVLVTSDLKHHATSEALADSGVALVDVAHWATEWPWLRQAADVVGTTVETSVSALVTDPWTVHAHETHRPE
jgi:dinuclear metal center YbgI/SA1388 family protein